MKIFTYVFALLFSVGLIAQEDVIIEDDDGSPFKEIENKGLTKDGKTFVDAFVNKNFDKVIEMSHPNIVEMGGGDVFMKQLLTDDRVMMENQRIKYISGAIDEGTEILDAGDELHCIVSQAIVMDIGGTKVKSYSNLLAASLDGGNNWKFVSLDQHDAQSIKVFVPAYNPKLIIPEKRPTENVAN